MIKTYLSYNIEHWCFGTQYDTAHDIGHSKTISHDKILDIMKIIYVFVNSIDLVSTFHTMISYLLNEEYCSFSFKGNNEVIS